MAKQKAGYHVGYSYCGRMPDGSWQNFSSQKEYWEAFDQEISDNRPIYWRKSVKDWPTYMRLKAQGLV